MNQKTITLKIGIIVAPHQKIMGENTISQDYKKKLNTAHSFENILIVER